jgi:competence protein ComEC
MNADHSASEKQLSKLRITMIDVGWGDSSLLEYQDSSGSSRYALVDSNDTSTVRSSHTFLKRFFEKKNIPIPSIAPVFDWVLLTHAHADHGQGIKRILKDFGSSCFWHSRSANQPAFLAALLRYAVRSPRVGQLDIVDSSKIIPTFGSAAIQVLWPPPGIISSNENNNSIVLAITLGNVSLLLTGDAEAEGVWTQIGNQIPSNTKFFKVPHHGAENGTFTTTNTTPWLTSLPSDAVVGISSHVRPFPHPAQSVAAALSSTRTYRTDQHYHVTLETDGNSLQVSYSHI